MLIRLRAWICMHVVEFWVNGSTIPEVSWDIGDSWAGLLPISNDPDETRKVRLVLLEALPQN